MTTVLIADDHVILRQGLKTMIEQHGMRVAAEAGDGIQAVELALEHNPDVVIMDIHMPRCNGVEATRQINEANPDIHVIALSMYPKRHFVTEMLKAGAKGYILKDCAFDELIHAIEQVLQGNAYLSREISDVVLNEFVSNVAEQRAPLEALTPRELEILRLLGEGHGSKDIASKLRLSPSTVDVHRHNIMRKLKLGSVAELVRYAIGQGISSV